MGKYIDGLIEMVTSLRSGDYDPFEFSIDLQDYLYNHYDAMLDENPKITHALNQELPDICDEMEPGMESVEFIKKIGEETDRILS